MITIKEIKNRFNGRVYNNFTDEEIIVLIKYIDKLEEIGERIIDAGYNDSDTGKLITEMENLINLNKLDDIKFDIKPSMIYLTVNGKRSSTSFRCNCGANVFTQYGTNKFKCNGCEERYVGK